MQFEPDMLTVDEALERVLGLVRVVEAEEQPLLDAVGQVLAQDVIAELDLPSGNNSAMDGYALQCDSIRGATAEAPKTLRVVGQLQAGQLPQQEVTPGAAIRIMTGAVIPSGADTVVPLELTDEVSRTTTGRPLDEIAILRELPRGRHIRPGGEDVRKGERVLTQGGALRPGEVGLLASLGLQRVAVIRRPVVAILATGDELVEPGQSLGPGKLYNSNTYALAAAVQRCGGIAHLLGIAGDNLAELSQKVEQGLTTDMLITSGGVSKGEFDIVKDVLAQRGEMAFWSVRMRPGKPLAVGLLGGAQGRPVPHVGLPGNPVSALVTFEELVRPALLKMMGRTNLTRPTIEAILEDPIENLDGRRVYARAVVTKRDGAYYARLSGPQGSNIITSVVAANGLAICPEDVEELKVGERAEVRMLDWNEECV